VDGDRDFKFCRQVGRNKFQLTDDKTPMKSAWSDHVTSLHFWAEIISLEWLKLEAVIKFKIQLHVFTSMASNSVKKIYI